MGHLADLFAHCNVFLKRKQGAIDHHRGKAQADGLYTVFKTSAVVQMNAHGDGRVICFIDHRFHKGILYKGQLIRMNGDDHRRVLGDGFLDDPGEDHIAGCVESRYRKIVFFRHIQNGFHVY